jgi:predicted TIM-barrel fold metal-dependent hydrolase
VIELARVIDSHTHIFPAKIAVKASQNIGSFYDIPMRYDGTLETLLKLGEKEHIDQFLVHSVATAPSQVEQINNFIAESAAEYPDKLIGFASLHPDMDNIGDEVDRAISLGLHGIKLHPDFQQFNLDDKAAYKIYEAAENRIPILTHTGDNRHFYSYPARIPAIMKDFPKLKMICAHLGGWSQWLEAEQYLKGLDIWVDTSSSFFALDNDTVVRLINMYGEDRVVFGSDYPMWDPGAELERFYTLPLSDRVKEKILSQNLCDLLGIE